MRFLQLPLIGALAFPLAEDINLRCESIEVPQSTNQKIEVQIRGHKIFVPGIQDYNNTMTLTFTETDDAFIRKLLKAWRELMWGSATGSSFNKSEVEATLQLTMLNNKDQPTFEYIIYGCFLEAADLGTLDSSGNDILRPSMTLSFDYFVDRPIL